MLQIMAETIGGVWEFASRFLEGYVPGLVAQEQEWRRTGKNVKELQGVCLAGARCLRSSNLSTGYPQVFYVRGVWEFEMT